MRSTLFPAGLLFTFHIITNLAAPHRAVFLFAEWQTLSPKQ